MSEEKQTFTNNTDSESRIPQNTSQTEYSFWAEQAATGQSKDTEIHGTSALTENHNQTIGEQFQANSNGPIPNIDLDIPKKKKKGHFRKFGAFTAKAALFGVIASASFIGFNEVFYRINPEAKPMSSRPLSSNKGSNNSKLNLDAPSKGSALSTTVTTGGVNISSADVSALVEETMPATVSISSVYKNSYYMWGQEYEEESEGGGSGIIIGKSDTELLIATNNHVVENTSKIIINFIDDSTAEATIKGRDSQADLAVVSVDISSLSKETLDAITVAKLGDSESVKVGQMVVAIGNALGYGQSVTVGYISAKDREISIGNKTTMTVLQTDAAINPGNSGGALLNMNGEVIGINSAKLADTDVEGIGYSIPISNAIPIVNELMNREILSDEEKGYIGIYPQDVSAEVAAAYNWPVGVYVYELAEGGAAEKAGILKGDIITSINGITISSSDQLRELVNSYRYGTKVTVTLERIKNGVYEEQTFEVTLQKNTDTTQNSNGNQGNLNQTPDGQQTPNDQEVPDTQQVPGDQQAPNGKQAPNEGSSDSDDSSANNEITDQLKDFLDKLLP